MTVTRTHSLPPQVGLESESEFPRNVVIGICPSYSRQETLKVCSGGDSITRRFHRIWPFPASEGLAQLYYRNQSCEPPTLFDEGANARDFLACGLMLESVWVPPLRTTTDICAAAKSASHAAPDDAYALPPYASQRERQSARPTLAFVRTFP